MSSVIRGDDNFDTGVELSLGVGQTWQSPAGRGGGVEYQNTTGRPIVVSASFTSTFNETVYLKVSPTSGAGYILVDACDVGEYYSSNQGTTQRGTVQAIVPNGHYYKIDVDGIRAVTQHHWVELR